MLVTGVTVEVLARRARARWTATNYSWVFVNGALLAAALPIAAGEQFCDLLPSPDGALPDPFILEVHDCVAGETPVAISAPLARRPALWWASVAGASQYLAYRIAPGDAAAELLIARTYPQYARHEEFRVSDLRADGENGWNRFAVEAVNARGTIPARYPWWWWEPSLPAPVIGLSVANGGALGDFTVTLEIAA